MSFDIGEFWRNKRAITVPQCTSDDSKCGLYAIGISELCPDKDPGRITKKLKEHIQKYNGSFECEFKVNSDVDISIEGQQKVKFNMTAKDMVKFEKLNPELRIMVLGARTDHKTYTILKDTKSPNVILMLFMNKSGVCHWTVVRDFGKLNYSETKSKRKRYHCTNCHTQFFYSEKGLNFHMELCLKNEVQMCTMPKPGTKLKFRNHQNMLFVPIAVYSDFECYQDVKHTPSGYGVYIKSIDDSVFTSRYISKTFKGDVAKDFVDQVLGIRKEVDRIPVRNMEMTDDDVEYHIHADKCWICSGMIDDKPTVTKNKENYDMTKVRDHCHFTGKYRGPAHQKCNLKLRRQKFVPVIFHNLKGYDSHFLINAFRGLSEDIDAIPESAQKFKTLSLKKPSIKLDDRSRKYFSTIKFLDSFEFKKKALSKLTKEITDFPLLDSEFSIEQSNDLRRKGVFPYEWFDCYEKLSHTKFPDHESFRSRLMGFEEVNGIIVGKNISKDDYDHGRLVFEKYCENMGDYHDLYMKGDVVLLADIFENFRKDAYNNFSLDPLNYITLASYAWDCVLKFTKVELELLSDMDMYNFFEQGIRGGYSNCHKNYSKVNHKYLPDFDPSKPSVFIMY